MPAAHMQKEGKIKTGMTPFLNLLRFLLPGTASENAEHVEEDVDEVEIELECAEYGEILADDSGAALGSVVVSLDLLHIPRCEEQEQDDADVADQKGLSQERDEDAGNACDHKSNQTADQNAAELGEINVGGMADDRAAEEHHGCEGKGTEECAGVI